MKFDFELETVFKRHPVMEVHNVLKQEAAFRQFHPGIPLGVTRAAQWMMAVTLTGPHLDASTRESFPGSQTDVGLLAPLGTVGLILWDESTERTFKAAVRLFRRQLHWGLVLWLTHD